ncbi:MAG: LEPR-XLL domain-containing protein, partial [Deltaproteobacteria bacterium]|nr:LEPR-XLL domain-containing protein [Deltaproteobacteria bacterium]
MKKSENKNLFELENLEPRILLSVDPVLGIAGADFVQDTDNSIQDMAVEEILLSVEQENSSGLDQAISGYDPSEETDDIFSGMSELELASTINPDSDYVINNEDSEAIIDGLEEIADFVARLEESGIEAINLYMPDGSELQLSLGIYDLFDTHIYQSVYDYFYNGLDPPDIQGLITAIEDAFSSEDSSANITGRYDADTNEIRFELYVTLDQSGELRLDFVPGSIYTDNSSIGTDIDYVAEIALGIVFGLDLDNQKPFFVQSIDLDISIDAAIKGITPDLTEDLHFEVSLSIRPEELSAGNRISASQLEQSDIQSIIDIDAFVEVGN